MQTMYVLQLQGLGDDELAFETAGVFTTRELAEAKADAVNAEYEDDDDVEDDGDDYD